MPMKPKVPCRHPGCAELVAPGKKYCEKHKRMHPEEIQPAATRGYGSRWSRESKKLLQLHPLCEECLRHGIAMQCPRRLWTTSFRTEEIRSSSGTDRTGSHCVRGATTGRPEEIIRRCVQEPKFEGHDRLLFLMQFSGLAGSYLRLDIEAQYH